MTIDNKQTFTVSADVLFQEINGETVLLDLASENYFGLDEVGTRIWTLINEGKAASEVAESLLERYDIDPATLETDIEQLLSSLLEAGLICADAE